LISAAKVNFSYVNHQFNTQRKSNKRDNNSKIIAR
jgi:hypothetical protein